MKLPLVDAKEVMRILLENGYHRIGQSGSHIQFKNGSGTVVTVPLHPGHPSAAAAENPPRYGALPRRVPEAGWKGVTKQTGQDGLIDMNHIKEAEKRRNDALVETQHTIAKKGFFLTLNAPSPKNTPDKHHKERFRSLRAGGNT